MTDKKKKINELRKDTRNANIGSELGEKLISNSFKELGAGRSVLADKNLNLIAGNHALDGAIKAGITEIIVVPTDGTKLVVVQRTDLDIDSKKGRQMALVDNASAKASINFDKEVTVGIAEEFGIDLDEIGIALPEVGGGPHGFNDDDYDEDDAADRMETSSKEESNSGVENIFPLSVVMNKAAKLGWEQFKKRYAFKTDQEAFDAIYNFAKVNYEQ